MKKRIYRVELAEDVFLVRASNKSQAVSHVVRNLTRVHLASQEEIVALVGGGTPVENAVDDEPEPTPVASPVAHKKAA